MAAMAGLSFASSGEFGWEMEYPGSTISVWRITSFAPEFRVRSEMSRDQGVS